MPPIASYLAVTDFTKSANEIIIDLINRDNGTQFKPEFLQIGTPTVLEGVKYNTAVVISSANVLKYSGTATISYNRKDLAAVPQLLSKRFLLGDATTISDLIPAINTRYSINLTIDDYVDEELPTLLELGRYEEKPFTIVVKSNSLIYVEALELIVFREAVDGISIYSLFNDTILDGLIYTQ